MMYAQPGAAIMFSLSEGFASLASNTNAAPWRGCVHDDQAPSDSSVRSLKHSFRTSGGVASCDEVTRLLRDHSNQPISQLARWIVTRQLVSFAWRSQTFIPLFQFDFAQMTIRPCVQLVIAELSNAFDDWEVANWFVRPNSALDYLAPLEMLATDLAGVLSAARADRYVALG
jgi:hypothetical protein